MKHLVLVLCLLLTNVHANEPAGIRFFGGSWQQVLAEAKRQNKPLFVDFHTDWCPPCRRMEIEAFPNPLIGEKYNTTFINYQLNAEIGEGIDVAKQYGIRSFPTALYFTANGDLVHRSVGYAGVNAMLTQADQVLRMPKMRRTLGRRRRNS